MDSAHYVCVERLLCCRLEYSLLIAFMSTTKEHWSLSINYFILFINICCIMFCSHYWCKIEDSWSIIVVSRPPMNQMIVGLKSLYRTTWESWLYEDRPKYMFLLPAPVQILSSDRRNSCCTLIHSIIYLFINSFVHRSRKLFFIRSILNNVK